MAISQLQNPNINLDWAVVHVQQGGQLPPGLCPCPSNVVLASDLLPASYNPKSDMHKLENSALPTAAEQDLAKCCLDVVWVWPPGFMWWDLGPSVIMGEVVGSLKAGPRRGD